MLMILNQGFSFKSEEASFAGQCQADKLPVMKRRSFFHPGFGYLWIAAISLTGCNGPSGGGNSIKLQSSAFTPGGEIPPQYTCDAKKGNISPPLRWDEPPPGTRSFALICEDPDAPLGTFVHWVLYDLPPQTRQLPESVFSPDTPDKFPTVGVQGKNDFLQLGYGGPCPPSGTHRYFFKLYALDKNLGLSPGATKQQVWDAMEGHILATGELMARYRRQR